MLNLVRLLLMGACAAVATLAFGAHLGLIDAPMAATLRAADRADAPGAVPRPAAATPAPLTELTRSHLTERHADIDPDWAPDPAQGTRRVTPRGHAWWGAGPTEGAPRPVVLLLHGAGRDGRSLIDMWHETAEAQGLILVAPDYGDRPESPEGLYDPAVALDALAHAATLHPVDGDRIVVFGHSRGGIAAQLWANRVAGPWRAVAVHAGTLPADLPRPVADGVPVRHYLGSADATFPFLEGRASARAMAAAGHPFELVRLEGHSHWLYATGEAIAADAWTWLAARIE